MFLIAWGEQGLRSLFVGGKGVYVLFLFELLHGRRQLIICVIIIGSYTLQVKISPQTTGTRLPQISTSFHPIHTLPNLDSFLSVFSKSLSFHKLFFSMIFPNHSAF